MIAKVEVTEKSFGNKMLYEDLSISIQPNERLGIIGRNGTGKSTLFNIITGLDKDYAGKVTIGRGVVVIASRQESLGYEHMPVLEYILADLPEYAHLKHIMDTYPAEMSHSQRKMQDYSDALERFAVLDYYTAEEEIRRMLHAYQLTDEQIDRELSKLSGGQKRFVELVKVQRSQADVSLIDEPTNHMDYVAKEAFLEWLKQARGAVVVITHDRDVLEQVDRIIEIRDGKGYSFKGGYSDYLRSNTSHIASQVNEFAVEQRRIANLRDDIIRYRRLKERAHDPGTISRFKSLEVRSQKELEELSAKEKPSFWIDRESVQTLNTKVTNAYDTHKAQNIKVRANAGNAAANGRLLVEATNLSLGYGDKTLFSEVSFQLREGERIRLSGRNGAGKSTLVRTLLAKAEEKPPTATIFQGTIAVESEIRVGVYEQEISPEYVNMTLGKAIEHIYLAKDLMIPDHKIKQLLGDYLFNAATDDKVPVSQLSGGQKARLQLIAMLAGEPKVLVLDEPTNHLDLPSIEELEDALAKYHGAILFISHDSYFARHLGGTEIHIGAE
ncbi:MAG: ABC-F family ATP-binding cassette domain-containing protein [Candidatus Saccharimonadales bacterium]